MFGEQEAGEVVHGQVHLDAVRAELVPAAGGAGERDDGGAGAGKLGSDLPPHAASGSGNHGDATAAIGAHRAIMGVRWIQAGAVTSRSPQHQRVWRPVSGVGRPVGADLDQPAHPGALHRTQHGMDPVNVHSHGKIRNYLDPQPSCRLDDA